jgi:WD40 repeat protein
MTTLHLERNVSLPDHQVDGCKLAAAGADGTVAVWDDDGAKSFESNEHINWVNDIRWNVAQHKTHLFVTGSWDQVNISIQIIQFKAK